MLTFLQELRKARFWAAAAGTQTQRSTLCAVLTSWCCARHAPGRLAPWASWEAQTCPRFLSSWALMVRTLRQALCGVLALLRASYAFAAVPSRRSVVCVRLCVCRERARRFQSRGEACGSGAWSARAPLCARSSS